MKVAHAMQVVHHVDVDPVGVCCFDRSDLFSKPPDIGREYRGCDDRESQGGYLHSNRLQETISLRCNRRVERA
jgi:hypothetical protein